MLKRAGVSATDTRLAASRDEAVAISTRSGSRWR
jgi:hypothetical protein